MSEINYEEFHRLVEQFAGEMSIKSICQQENVSYRCYLTWRRNHGYSTPRKASAPRGLVELDVEGVAQTPARALNVHIEFENGLRIDRAEMAVESLIKFLTQIRPVLCLS